MASSSSNPESLDWELLDSIPTSSPLADDSGNNKRFVNKVIVITGAGGQLGREGCLYFAEQGARIAALDVVKEGLMETFAEVVKVCPNGVDFKPYLCNVTTVQQVQDVLQHVAKTRFGQIDYLWNNAGYQGQIAPIVEQNPTDFANVMNINVTGMFHVLQEVGKIMIQQCNDDKPQPCCSIVNTASVAGLRGTPAMVAYASSKAAVMAMSVCSAKEWARYNIRVNSISPALIGPGKLWERQNELHAQVGAPYFADTPDAVAKAKIGSVPMQRLGSSREVVKSVAFLLSDEASYTTGINLTCDGGMAAGLKA